VRPSSALKKPPQIKNNVQVEDTRSQMKKEGPTGLIIDGEDQNEEEDFVLEEG